MRDAVEGLELAEVVQRLREEVEHAVERGRDKKLKFDLEEVQLELQVAVTREGSGKTGFKLWVVDAEVGAKLAQTQTQKVVLKLKPRGRKESAVSLADDVGEA
jgi:hypothetical protein